MSIFCRSRSLRLAAIVAFAVATGATTGTGQERPGSDGVAAAIDATLASAYGPDVPGAVAIVVKDGRVILRKGYGLANVELGVPMRPEMVMALSSLTKQFTAAGILKLAEQGKLALNDEITKFLPNYPARGAKITIEHLLTHTSGISGLAETADLRAVATGDAKVIDVIDDWVKDLPPDFAPGERWAYSNWGYNLLGAIIERASGQSYADFLQQAIFDRAGMTHTYYADARRVIPLRATGYDLTGDTAFNVLPPRSRVFHPTAAGGLLSTVDDLARWSAALDRDSASGPAGTEAAAPAPILSRASIERMFTSFRLNDGTPTGYGYGWDIGEYDGSRVQEHQGGTAGFLSHIVRMPDAGVFVAILSNRYSMTVPLQATAHRVAALAAGRPITEPAAVPLRAGTLESLVGTYRGSDVGTCTIALDGDALTARVAGLGKMRLVPVGPLVFRTPLVTWTFTFETDAGGIPVRLRIRDWKLNDLAERVEPAPTVVRPVATVETSQLDACAGEYEALDGILVTIERADDHLRVQPFGQPAVDVFPVSAIEFVTREADVQYAFVTDARGVMTGFLRSTGGRPVPARRTGAPRRRTSDPAPVAPVRGTR